MALSIVKSSQEHLQKTQDLPPSTQRKQHAYHAFAITLFAIFDVPVSKLDAIVRVAKIGVNAIVLAASKGQDEEAKKAIKYNAKKLSNDLYVIPGTLLAIISSLIGIISPKAGNKGINLAMKPVFEFEQMDMNQQFEAAQARAFAGRG